MTTAAAAKPPTPGELLTATMNAFPRVLTAHGLDPDALTERDNLIRDLVGCALSVAYVTLRVEALAAAAEADLRVGAA